MAESTSPFVVTSERSSTGLFSSFGALTKQVGHHQIIGPYERPPFPIITDRPTVSDVFANMRVSDLFFGASIYFGGIFASYIASRPFPSVMQRIVAYHGMSHLFFISAAFATFSVPVRRLTGFWDNGLRWKKPENKLRKYDMTSHYEKATGWSRFRVNLD